MSDDSGHVMVPLQDLVPPEQDRGLLNIRLAWTEPPEKAFIHIL